MVGEHGGGRGDTRRGWRREIEDTLIRRYGAIGWRTWQTREEEEVRDNWFQNMTEERGRGGTGRGWRTWRRREEELARDEADWKSNSV